MVIYKCCCKKGTRVGNQRYQLYATEVNASQECIYCGYVAFADNDANSSGSVVHVKYKSDKAVMKDLKGDDDYHRGYECFEDVRAGLYGYRNGKAISPCKD